MPPARRLAAVPLAAALAGVALLAAGCGGSGPRGSAIANIGATTAATATTTASSTPAAGQSKKQAAFAYSRCMRANGVPSFPDPQTSGGGIRINAGSGSKLDPRSPAFQAAQRRCQKLLPNGGTLSQQQIAKAEQQLLAFARCMRSHGVPSFPDPTFDASGGGLRVRIGGPGVDPSSPAFRRAQQACGSLAPGVVQKGAPSGSGSGSGGAAGSR